MLVYQTSQLFVGTDVLLGSLTGIKFQQDILFVMMIELHSI